MDQQIGYVEFVVVQIQRLFAEEECGVRKDLNR